MTIDDVLEDAISKSSHRASLVAAYAIRKGGNFFGYVEARLNPHGSPNPIDWEISWIAYWQKEDGRMASSTSEDLHALLQPFGAIDLTTAMLGGPVAFFHQCRQANGGAEGTGPPPPAETPPPAKSSGSVFGWLARLRGKQA